ncbi:hypothetical protein AA700_0095 [Acidiphilium acidophilum DSM 700]|nr:hypothetical protein AA700_0095 [Acidiphilium acidophilum DSM 700]
MLVLMYRRRGFCRGRDVVGGRGLMIMLMLMDDAAVPVRVCMARQNSNAFQRGVEFVFIVIVMAMIVSMATMFMLGKMDGIGMVMLAVTECDSYLESVWLGNFVEGFPIFSAIGEGERLALAPFADCLSPHPIDSKASEPEMRRDTVLEY